MYIILECDVTDKSFIYVAVMKSEVSVYMPLSMWCALATVT